MNYEKLWKDLKLELEKECDSVINKCERLESQFGPRKAKSVLDRMNQAEVLGNR